MKHIVIVALALAGSVLNAQADSDIYMGVPSSDCSNIY